MDGCCRVRGVLILAACLTAGCGTASTLKGSTALGEAMHEYSTARAHAADPAPRTTQPPLGPPAPIEIPKAPKSVEPPKEKGQLQPPPLPDPNMDPNVQPAKAGNVKFTGRVIARVNGVPILEEDAVAGALNQLLLVRRSNLPPGEKAGYEKQIMRESVEQLIDREVLLQDAFKLVPERTLAKAKEFARKDFESKIKLEKEQLKVSSDEDYQQLLETFGITLEHRRRQFERNFIASEYLKNRVRSKVENIAIDREQLAEYYEKNPKEFDPPESVKWLHISINKQVPTEEEARRRADAAYEDAKKCKTKDQFAELAERTSDGASRKRKGEGEGNERGQVRPVELEDAVFKMKPGDMSPLLATKDAYHIILIVSHDPGGKIPLEQACATIRSKLQNEAANAEFQRFLKELRGKAYIEMANR